MAISVQVNPNTVQRTYQWLQDEDLIIQKRGIGFFLTDNVFQKTLKLKKQDFIKNIA
ncbi:MAG: hypothetical protein IPJ43_06130 [Saprospiraceae bacterium]|nr:hypothetical protein [Saprospiraceae bacterium]